MASDSTTNVSGAQLLAPRPTAMSPRSSVLSSAAVAAAGDAFSSDVLWPLKVVTHEGGMQAGGRVACAMPYDMLSLQGQGQLKAIEEVFGWMQLRGRE